MEMIQMRSKKEIKKTSVKKTTKKELKPAKKPGRKREAKKVQIIEDVQDEQPTASIEDFNNTVDTSFFYTNDKHLNAIDDIEVLNRISARYPEFNQKNKDSQLKKCFLQILDDDQFIADLLDYFNLTIFDFFKIIYKNYAALFNTLFIKKVKDKIKSKKYARV